MIALCNIYIRVGKFYFVVMIVIGRIIKIFLSMDDLPAICWPKQIYCFLFYYVHLNPFLQGTIQVYIYTASFYSSLHIELWSHCPLASFSLSKESTQAA